MKRILVWFRSDLRVNDHEALSTAVSKADEVIPYYCLDERMWQTTTYGFPKTGAFRTQFLLESLENLSKQIEGLGGKLLVETGKPEEKIPELVARLHVDAVYAHKEVTDEEIKVEEALEHQLWKQRVPLNYFWGHTLYHLEDLPFPIKNLPEVFTNFRKQMERDVAVRPLIPAPQRIRVPAGLNPVALPSLQRFGLPRPLTDERAVLSFTGGETEAQKRLQYYVWEEDLLKNYKQTRNELMGGDFSSKLAPWLAFGCISPRQVHHEVKAYEKKRIKNESTYWLIFELMWRDYFRFMARKHGNALFKPGGIRELPAKESERRFDREVFEYWRTGTTGIPFVDANMTELALTGFMSNRGRQNVASFLVKDLKIDWRAGAAWFESQLIDYDPCSNYGNWNYMAGVGNDPREDRYFHVIKQAQQYDPKGEYIKLWLPALAALPVPQVYAPYLLSAYELEFYGVWLGKTYPFPILEIKPIEYSR